MKSMLLETQVSGVAVARGGIQVRTLGVDIACWPCTKYMYRDKAGRQISLLTHPSGSALANQGRGSFEMLPVLDFSHHRHHFHHQSPDDCWGKDHDIFQTPARPLDNRLKLRSTSCCFG